MSAQPCLRVLRRGVSELSTTLWWHVRMWAHCLVGASPPRPTDGARDGGADGPGR